MDQVILREKLESLRRCITRVQQKIPDSVAALEADADTQDIIVLNLTRAVQVCVDLGTHIISDTNEPAPQSMGEVFETLERLGVISHATALALRKAVGFRNIAVPLALRKAVGFRNIAVHSYQAINWAIVYSISDRHLEDFRQFAKEISERFLEVDRH